MNLNSAQEEGLALIDSGRYTGEEICRKMGTEQFRLVSLEAMAKEGIIHWQGEYWERNAFYQEPNV